MMSIASAKNVKIKGNVSVTSSPLNISTTTKAITDKKNNSQYNPLDLRDFSIQSDLVAKV
jgi:hypothetical protein